MVVVGATITPHPLMTGLGIGESVQTGAQVGTEIGAEIGAQAPNFLKTMEMERAKTLLD